MFVSAFIFFGICALPEMRQDGMRSRADEKPPAINQCNALIFPVMSFQNVDAYRGSETYTHVRVHTGHKDTSLHGNIYIKDM